MAKILIVEDEFVLAANLEESLEKLGYAVVGVANSAAEAFEKAVVLQPNIVLMDIRLQGETDGIQAAEHIWNELQIPVVYLTGHADRSTLERVKVSLPFGYLLKPVREPLLHMAIETALNRYEREQMLSTVLRSMGDGMIVVNTQGRVMYLNRSAELLTGWQQSAARDRDLPEVFNVVDEATRRPVGNLALTAIQDDTTVFLNERFLLTTKEGETFPITDSIAPIKNHKGLITGAVLVFRGDTRHGPEEKRPQALQPVEALQLQPDALALLQDDFVRAVAYALSTPLTNIKLTIQMLETTLKDKSELDATVRAERIIRYLTALRDRSNQELSVVNNLLELQQIEVGAHPVQWSSIDPQALLLASLENFQVLAQSYDHQLQVRIPANLPVMVSDPTILKRILAELLGNACKYTPPGGEITCAVSLEAEERVQFSVCNRGVEIAADDLPHLFERFYRVRTSDRVQQGGTGLGLALVKQLVTHLGGAVWAESGAGQTRFVVELPLAPPQGDHPGLTS